MEITIRLGGPITFRFGLDDWIHGSETDSHHALVPIDPDLAETLWTNRRKPKALAEIIVEHGEELIKSELAELIEPSATEREEVAGFLAGAVPSMRSVVEQLPDEVLGIPWRLARSYVEGWDRYVELAPEILVEAKRADLVQLITVLMTPSLLGYGAVFDSRAGLMQEAASVCVRRPVHNAGFGPDVMYFGRRPPRMIARPSARRLSAVEDIYIVTRPEWDDALTNLRALAKLDDHDRGLVDEARERFEATECDLFFHTITKWDDYVIGTASGIDEGNREGVFVRAGRNPIYAKP